MNTLFIVATPIGNLEDMTFRAVRVLQEVDCIACENRLRSLALLQHFDIHKRLIVCSPKNQDQSIPGILALMAKGMSIAYISDAGTPGMSDPGNRLVYEARCAGFAVSPVPGASAFSTLLSVCGLPYQQVVFLGFLSKKASAIQKALEPFAHDPGTLLVIYASKYQIEKVLQIAQALFPNAWVVLGREMTKKFEEFRSAPLAEILQRPLPDKGEWTIGILTQAARLLA